MRLIPPSYRLVHWPALPALRRPRRVAITACLMGGVATVGTVVLLRALGHPRLPTGMPLEMRIGREDCAYICSQRAIDQTLHHFDAPAAATACLQAAGRMGNSVFLTCMDASLQAFDKTISGAKAMCRAQGLICP